jgi:hypothetical protein
MLDGYTYGGRVMSHHAGGDSRDLFIRVDYRMPSAGSG